MLAKNTADSGFVSCAVGLFALTTSVRTGPLRLLKKSLRTYQAEGTVNGRDSRTAPVALAERSFYLRAASCANAVSHRWSALAVRVFLTGIKIRARIRQALTRTLRPPHALLEGSLVPIIGAVIAAATSRDFLAFVAILTIGLCVEAAIPRYDYDTAAEPIWQRLRRNITVGSVWLLVVLPIGITPILLAAPSGFPLASSALDARSGVPDRRFGDT
jgi:hypothetical protein